MRRFWRHWLRDASDDPNGYRTEGSSQTVKRRDPIRNRIQVDINTDGLRSAAKKRSTQNQRIDYNPLLLSGHRRSGGVLCSRLDEKGERVVAMRKRNWVCLLAMTMIAFLTLQAGADEKTIEFRAGAADADITPPVGMPMWGYGARHAMLSVGTLDPLMAKAIVIAAGNDKVALVGTDLGRGPTEAMMKMIRQEIAEKAGIKHVMITGSHSHHGPVIELLDEPGLGKGKFDTAVNYSKKLPQLLVEVILAADKGLRPAKMGIATESVNLNRNRHTKRDPKVTDPCWPSFASTICRASRSASLSTSPRTPS